LNEKNPARSGLSIDIDHQSADAEGKAPIVDEAAPSGFRKTNLTEMPLNPMPDQRPTTFRTKLHLHFSSFSASDGFRL
jgi:hypothetical protein